MSTAILERVDGSDTPIPLPPIIARRGRLVRLFTGRPKDPAWVRPALLSLLALTAVAYIWDLGA
jgi:hypothetical protein